MLLKNINIGNKWFWGLLFCIINIIMFSCFTDLFKVIKTNILGFPEEREMSSAIYNIQKKGETG